MAGKVCLSYRDVIQKRDFSSSTRSSLIAALNIWSFFFYRMTHCVCCRYWTGWCCYWSDKSRRSDSGWCLPWFLLSWWVDMMQREACSARSAHCLPLSICLSGSPRRMMFVPVVFLLVSVSAPALIISQAAFYMLSLPLLFSMFYHSLPLCMVRWMVWV